MTTTRIPLLHQSLPIWTVLFLFHSLRLGTAICGDPSPAKTSARQVLKYRGGGGGSGDKITYTDRNPKLRYKYDVKYIKELDAYIDFLVSLYSTNGSSEQVLLEKNKVVQKVSTNAREAPKIKDDDDNNADGESAELITRDKSIRDVSSEEEENNLLTDEQILQQILKQDEDVSDSDYDLDQYVDFLLSTTSARPPGQETVETATYFNNNITASTEEIFILEDEVDEGINGSIRQEMDNYIDLLVGAVELDEYIDRLVSTISTQDLVDDKERKEDKDNAVEMDSYIETLVATHDSERVGDDGEAPVMQSQGKKKIDGLDEYVDLIVQAIPDQLSSEDEKPSPIDDDVKEDAIKEEKTMVSSANSNLRSEQQPEKSPKVNVSANSEPKTDSEKKKADVEAIEETTKPLDKIAKVSVSKQRNLTTSNHENDGNMTASGLDLPSKQTEMSQKNISSTHDTASQTMEPSVKIKAVAGSTLEDIHNSKNSTKAAKDGKIKSTKPTKKRSSKKLHSQVDPKSIDDKKASKKGVSMTPKSITSELATKKPSTKSGAKRRKTTSEKKTASLSKTTAKRARSKPQPSKAEVPPAKSSTSKVNTEQLKKIRKVQTSKVESTGGESGSGDEAYSHEPDVEAEDSTPLPRKVSSEASNEEEADVAPIHLPNGLYRLLLRKGPVGHVLCLALVMLVEWIQVYLPQVADLASFLWLKVAPINVQRRLAPRVVDGDATSPVSSLQQQYSGRMPVKGKQRKLLSKRADQEALAQLRRVGDIQDAKYKHVSLEFMKRHALGPYRDDYVMFEGGEDETLGVVDTPKARQSASRKTASKGNKDGDEEESDVDWVLQGLTKPLAKGGRSSKSRLNPSVSVGMGSSGPSIGVGVELDFGGGGRTSKAGLDKEALTRNVVRKKRGPGSGADRDDGGSVMGRLRAAATSNSMVSRSLLGAYPGDAAQPSEAASARGITSLAQKYGYGDWSDDDDDDSSGGRTKSKGTKRKRRRKRVANSIAKPVEEDVLDLSGLFDDESVESRPRKTSKKRSFSRKKNTIGNNSPLLDDEALSLKELRKMERGIGDSESKSILKDDKKTVRPPLGRLGELHTEQRRRKSSKRLSAEHEKQRTTDNSKKIADLEKKSDRTRSVSVRPALERLKEAGHNQNKDPSKPEN